jgi:hypothetical protein
MSHRVAYAVASIIMVSGCGGKLTENNDLGPLRELQIERAPADARVALREGDKRLIGVYGVTIEIPGTDYTSVQAEALYGVRPLEGTSDTPARGEEVELNDKAREYARSYNLTIVALHPPTQGEAR